MEFNPRVQEASGEDYRCALRMNRSRVLDTDDVPIEMKRFLKQIEIYFYVNILSENLSSVRTFEDSTC